MKNKSLHSWFAGILVASFCLAAVLPWLAGGDFYARRLAQRPFHPLFHLLKRSGSIGHLFSLVGSGMILADVIIYSTRKRVRHFASVGKMTYFLELHVATPFLSGYMWGG